MLKPHKTILPANQIRVTVPYPSYAFKKLSVLVIRGRSMLKNHEKGPDPSPSMKASLLRLSDISLLASQTKKKKCQEGISAMFGRHI